MIWGKIVFKIVDKRKDMQSGKNFFLNEVLD